MKHPGFTPAALRIARRLHKHGVAWTAALRRARAILASSTRRASAAAKRRNLRLLRVFG